MKAIVENPAVLDAIAQLIGVAILALGGALTPLLLRWFRAHGVAIDEAQARLLEQAVRAGAGFAEEWAAGKIKGTGTAPSGAEKLQVAVDAAKQLARVKLRSWTDTQIKTAIEAHPPSVRASIAPAAAASALMAAQR